MIDLRKELMSVLINTIDSNIISCGDGEYFGYIESFLYYLEINFNRYIPIEILNYLSDDENDGFLSLIDINEDSATISLDKMLLKLKVIDNQLYMDEIIENDKHVAISYEEEFNNIFNINNKKLFKKCFDIENDCFLPGYKDELRNSIRNLKFERIIK